MMSLQGKSEEDIRGLEGQLLSLLQEMGGRATNTSLLRSLGWDESVYWPIRNQLVDHGKLMRRPGRGGVVALTESLPTESSVLNEAVNGVGSRPDNFVYERDLYEPVARVLEGPWARDLRFRYQVVEITASQGRKNTGGVWTRPDIVVAALRVFPYLPGKYFDLITFEVKPACSDVTAVYEALAHRRSATQSYVWIYCREADRQAQNENIERIKMEAERHGIGLIIAHNPDNYDAWDVLVDPIRVDPDPHALNEFIATQMSEGSREEIQSWVR